MAKQRRRHKRLHVSRLLAFVISKKVNKLIVFVVGKSGTGSGWRLPVVSA
jgi:hypothetical protein